MVRCEKTKGYHFCEDILLCSSPAVCCATNFSVELGCLNYVVVIDLARGTNEEILAELFKQSDPSTLQCAHKL